MSAFIPDRNGVLMVGRGGPVLLNPDQVSQMLDTFEREAKAAEAAAHIARQAFNALWDARCAALDAVCAA